MNITLSERQQRTVAVAITILAAAIVVGAVGLFGWVLARFLRDFSAVFLPLAVAWVAALVCRPYYDWLRDRLRLPPPAALAAVFLSVLIPLAAFLWVFGAVIVEQIADLVSRAPELWQRVTSSFRERWPQLREFLETPTGRRIQEGLSAAQNEILSGLTLFGEKALSAGAGVMRGIGTLFSWAVFPVYFAFFLMSKAKPVDSAQLLPFLKPETREDVLYLLREFVSIVVAFFRGQLIIAFLQGLLFAIGFSLVGLRYGFLIGLLLGFLNVIPYLGSIVGLSIAIPLAFFQVGGGLAKLIAVIIVFAVVQLIEGYVLTPKIMGERTGLHFMAIIVAIFFWGAALDGILGLILAIPLTAFFASLWRLAREKYITELV